MAIDTADKRASALVWPARVLPTPAGSIDGSDRRQLAGLYRIETFSGGWEHAREISISAGSSRTVSLPGDDASISINPGSTRSL